MLLLLWHPRVVSTPPSPQTTAGGGGGGGRKQSYVYYKHKKREAGTLTVKEILDLGVKAYYEALEPHDKEIVEATVTEYTKPLESGAPVIDWAAINQNIKRAEELIRLWKARMEDDDELAILLLS